MMVNVLMEIAVSGNGERYYTEAPATFTRIPGLVLTPYKSGYSITHMHTGRALNDAPLSMVQAMELIDDLWGQGIPWEKVIDGDNSILLRKVRLK